MEDVEKIEFELEGFASPIKMDRWLDLPQPKNEAGYLKQAEQKVYRDEKGGIAIPSNAVKAAMRYASSEIGKKTDAKKNRQTIAAQVFIAPTMLSLGREKHDGITRDIVCRGTGAKLTRVPTYRPVIKEWKVSGVVQTFGVPFDFVKEALELAGMRFGLLSHRPQFGRFIVNKFEVMENGKK